MRIAMISPLEMRVPPIAYGGTELVVSLLTEELIKKGHNVTLYASGDSVTSANLKSVCSRFLRGSNREKVVLNMLNVLTCAEQASRYDIIHNHTTLEGMCVSSLIPTPMLTTLHGDYKGDWWLLLDHYKGWYCTISRSAKSLLRPKERFAGVIYNAIDVNSYPFNGTFNDSYLLFLSRISHEKGPHLAIEVARKLGRKLIIAGNIDIPDEQYFRTMVLPQVDGDQIKFVGEANYHQKRELLASALALLAPISWEEPFGLFLVEAMACGTPVIVLNRGSASEVVKNGETGFVVSNVEEMAQVVGNVGRIDRAVCRRHVERHFNAPRMADDYIAAYEGILTNMYSEDLAQQFRTPQSRHADIQKV